MAGVYHSYDRMIELRLEGHSIPIFVADAWGAQQLLHSDVASVCWSVGAQLPRDVLHGVFTAIKDEPDQPLLRLLLPTLPALKKMLVSQPTQGLIIHCQAGQSRSVAALCVLLCCASPSVPAQDWLTWIHNRRPSAAINVGFLQQLRLFGLFMCLSSADVIGDAALAACTSAWVHLSRCESGCLRARPEYAWLANMEAFQSSTTHMAMLSEIASTTPWISAPFETNLVASELPKQVHSGVALCCARCGAQLAPVCGVAIALASLLQCCAAQEAAWRTALARGDSVPQASAAAATAAQASAQQQLLAVLQCCPAPVPLHWSAVDLTELPTWLAARVQFNTAPPDTICATCGAVWCQICPKELATAGHARWAAPDVVTRAGKVECKPPRISAPRHAAKNV